MMTQNESSRREGGSVGPEEPKVVVVILNWNRGQDTTACLESVRSLRYADFETIVVDNGSTDDSSDRTRT
jgi:GT2 family glycosyltransferase